MLENYNRFNFTELDFTMALIHELRKHGITSFNKPQLEEELYAYRDKYLALFLDIDCRDDRLHLDESIGILTITGEIFDLAPNFDKKYTRGMCELKNKSEYFPYYEEMAALVDEYVTRKKVETVFLKKNKIKLKIFGINPNQKYTLINGQLDVDKYISYSLVTTGKIIRGEDKSFEYSRVNIEIPSIKNREWSYLRNIKAEEVEVRDAQFTAIQGKINEKIMNIDLYCESTCENKLFNYARIGGTEKSCSDAKVLSLRKK